MTSNLLMVLREALPGTPTLRDLAREIGWSHTYLNSFERGEVLPPDERLAPYAKQVGLSVREVKVRYYRVRLDRLDREAREARQTMKGLGVRNPRNKKVARDVA